MNATPDTDRPSPWLLLGIPASMCLLALASLPYGYYTLLRLALTAGMIAWIAWYRTSTATTVIVVLILLLYNPILPVHFHRETWAPINIVTAIVLFAIAAASKP